MRVLVTGWPSFEHGEATAGDVLSMRRVSQALSDAGIPWTSAWSRVFRPGRLTLEDADPTDFSHLVFACGPVHGKQVEWLHEKFACCRRLAVGVTVVDSGSPAVTGFHHVLARDGSLSCAVDLSAAAEVSRVPVAGLVLAPGQQEYGDRRRNDEVNTRLTRWMKAQNCATLPLDTRLDSADWRHCSTPDQFIAVLSRLDVVVTSRLHGLALALRAGRPALAVDPVSGGGKVSAQAEAWDWPALLTAEQVCGPHCDALLTCWWEWCGSASGTRRAETCAVDAGEVLTPRLVEILRSEASAQ
jgi:hypothetical protein